MSFGVNAPEGFVPLTYQAAAPWTGKYNYYQIEPAYATSIGQGDLVCAGNSGYIRKYLPADAIASKNTGLAPIGVFLGCDYILPGSQTASNAVQNSPSWPANQTTRAGTPIMCRVSDDYDVIYTIQASGVVNFSSMNGNANFIDGVVDPVTGSSTASLDANSISKTAAGQGYGTVTMVNGVGSAGAPYIQAGSVVMLTQTGGTLAGTIESIAITAGTGFVVTSTTLTDTAIFNYVINAGSSDNSHLPIRLLSATQAIGNQFDPITGNGFPYININCLLNNHAYRRGTQGV